MPRFTVYYTHSVDGYVSILAPDEDTAQAKVEEAWDDGTFDELGSNPLDASDFEVLYVKKRPHPEPKPTQL